MAKTKRKTRKNTAAAARRYCSIPEVPERSFSPDVSSERARLIINSGSKWANGTTLRYYFFKSPAKWATTTQKRDLVRTAFKKWKDLGIGLEFKEVDSPDEAEIRIGFERRDGH